MQAVPWPLLRTRSLPLALPPGSAHGGGSGAADSRVRARARERDLPVLTDCESFVLVQQRNTLSRRDQLVA